MRRLLSLAVAMPSRTARLDDALDRWLLHPVFGLGHARGADVPDVPGGVRLGAPLMDAIDAGTAWVGAQATAMLPAGPLRSLLVDGVIAGVGGVVVFLPQILILFAFILALEESGYLPRAAFLLDRMMSKAGLSGVRSSRCCRASPARCRGSWPRAASRTRATASPPSRSRR